MVHQNCMRQKDLFGPNKEVLIPANYAMVCRRDRQYMHVVNDHVHFHNEAVRVRFDEDYIIHSTRRGVPRAEYRAE